MMYKDQTCLMKLSYCCFLQLVVEEVASLPEGEGFEVTASGVAQTMVVAEALADMNMETEVNFLVDLGVQLCVKGEGEVAVQVDQNRHLLLLGTQ